MEHGGPVYVPSQLHITLGKGDVGGNRTRNVDTSPRITALLRHSKSITMEGMEIIVL
jgi:hypothetical protein